MLSFKKPRVPKPKIPKIKKPDNSKRKKLDKAINSEVSAKHPSHKPEKKKTVFPEKKTSHTKKKPAMKHGICFSEEKCKGKVLSEQSTKSECKNLGGKSWKGRKGCESIK